MARELREIITHIRAVIANPNVPGTLIQTEDLTVLCDAADPELETAEVVKFHRILKRSLGGQEALMDPLIVTHLASFVAGMLFVAIIIFWP